MMTDFNRGDHVCVIDGIFRGERGQIIEVMDGSCKVYRVEVDGGEHATVRGHEIMPCSHKERNA